LRCQCIENGIGVWRQGSIIKGDYYLMVIERQCLPVLHATDLLEFVRADGEYATGAKRVWIARARILCARGEPTGRKQATEEYYKESHPTSHEFPCHSVSNKITKLYINIG
jgi:hypothetical protein